MNTTTAAVDLAKNVYQVAIATSGSARIEQHRLTRVQFDRFFANRRVDRIIMEACGSAHHRARRLAAQGFEVILLPAQYVRAYVRRNKTDSADAMALLEAAKAPDIRPVRVKSVEQQSLQALHRTRSLWMATRTSRINALRGFCRELGLRVPVGARTGLEAMGRAVADDASPIPALLRPTMQSLLDEIRVLETRVAQIERQLAAVVSESPACRLLMSRACVIAPAPIQTTVSAVLAPACRGDGTVASAVEARMRVMKAAAVPLPFAVDSRKARRKALMRPASTARMSQRRLKPAAASTALSASPVAPFNQQRAIR